MEVQVTRSERRRKTIQARVVDGVLHVAIPAHLTPVEEAEWVAKMRTKVEKRLVSAEVNLPDRAQSLAARYGLEIPRSIVWSDRQNTRWGSCTVATGDIRVSRQLAEFPTWVLDYVIVHEMAHLTEPGHTKEFWSLVNRYPKTERARGFLIAKSDGKTND